MDTDLILASAHHLAVFLLVGIVAAEFGLLKPGLDGMRVAQLTRIDAAYGAVAGLVVAVGVLQVIFGGSGWGYYAGNHAFWGKMAAFVAVGLLSIQPTLAIRRWHKAGKDNIGYVVPAAEIVTSRRFIHLQAGLLVLIPILAAAMARGYGMS
jgi:putative membrane protein